MDLPVIDPPRAPRPRPGCRERLLPARRVTRPPWRRRLAAALLGLVAGCAHYQPAPLPDSAGLAPDLGTLDATPAPGDALGLDAVAALAVRHNPDLRARRHRLDVAEAQVFAAGLLPDPQLSASLDLPFHNQPGLVTAWGAGLAWDIVQLITRPARQEAAHQQARQVRLDLVWQEWQVAQQARLTALRVIAERRRLGLLETMRDAYAERYRHSARALAEGNLTLDVSGTDLTALLDADSQVAQSEQALAADRIALNLLLGLVPGAELPLAPLPRCAPPDAAQTRAALADLPARRPDLRALGAGYAGQEASVEAAILGQFPSISLGASGARDTGDVTSAGLAATLDLPLFSGNRGAIAGARATRGMLAAEYQARLAQAAVDVATVTARQAVVSRQQALLASRLPTLQTLVERARGAYAGGDIDALTFLNMEQTLMNKQLEAISLEQATCANQVALEVLLALPAAATAAPAP
ncbi:MAG: TolC family protein [Gammaproteobacteria bacterium]|nr:TolC family protein [Gammaproteobacteria bacterium]